MEVKDIHELYADPVQSAAEAGLRYIPDTGRGFSRRKSGKGFTYLDTKGEKVSDSKILARLDKLIIPPAWENVWICSSPNGHIQATGRDLKGRKQYIYHPEWRATRSLTKFSRMIAFGETLPAIRQQIEKDLQIRDLNQRKVTAIVLNLLDQSLIRIGNRQYAEANKSYGLTTLRDKHVAIEGDQVKFQFVGKKGVSHEIDIKDRRLARLVKKCKDIPGFNLFQYYDADGTRQTLDSGQVNGYIQEISGTDFTAKDFRTWGGTVLMVECLEKLIDENPELEKEKSVKNAFKTVAKGLGNTPAVCSKYYVHPQILEIFKSDQLLDYLKKHDADQPSDPYLSATEKMVIEMLKSALQ